MELLEYVKTHFKNFYVLNVLIAESHSHPYKLAPYSWILGHHVESQRFLTVTVAMNMPASLPEITREYFRMAIYVKAYQKIACNYD